MAEKTFSMAKKKRYDIFKEAIKLMNSHDVSLGDAMRKVKHGTWKNRFNGHQELQLCSYQPNFDNSNWCVFPCNGDC